MKEKQKEITKEVKQPTVSQTVNGYFAEDDTNYIKWDPKNPSHGSIFDQKNYNVSTTEELPSV